MPGVVEHAVPLGREDREDLLPVPHHDHRAIGPDTAADVHAHERTSPGRIGPELIAGHALPRAGVEPGRRQEPHRLLTREGPQDVRPPPGRFLAVNLAHLVQERPRRHPDGGDVAAGVGRLEAGDADRRDGRRALDGQVVELAEVAVVTDRVAGHHQAGRGQAMDRRPDRRGDAAGLVDDHEQVAGVLAAEPFLVLRREPSAPQPVPCFRERRWGEL